MFGQGRGGFPAGLSVGEWVLRGCIFPGVFRRDDLRSEISFPVGDYHPDPLFVKNLRWIVLNRGSVNPGPGPDWAPFRKKKGTGGRIGAGFGDGVNCEYGAGFPMVAGCRGVFGFWEYEWPGGSRLKRWRC